MNYLSYNKFIIDKIIQTQLSVYHEEGCGICRQKGADVFWLSSYSRGAHQSCYDTINELQNMSLIMRDDRTNEEINRLHEELVGKVQAKCEPMSILEYYNAHGSSSLKQLFDQAHTEY